MCINHYIFFKIMVVWPLQSRGAAIVGTYTQYTVATLEVAQGPICADLFGK